MANKEAPAKPATPQKSDDEKAFAALRTLVIFSCLMVTVPTVLYLSSNNGFFDVLYKFTVGIPAPENRAVASAICAILGVNIVVVGFIYIAFQDLNEAPKPKTE